MPHVGYGVSDEEGRRPFAPAGIVEIAAYRQGAKRQWSRRKRRRSAAQAHPGQRPVASAMTGAYSASSATCAAYRQYSAAVSASWLVMAPR
jgi:hypothetical protein